MKVFLDDVRNVSWETQGSDWYTWVVVRTVDYCKRLLDAGLVEVISLDYDLSESDYDHVGMDVLEYIGDKLLSDPSYMPPEIYIHSMHARAKEMHQMVSAIQAAAKKRKEE